MLSAVLAMLDVMEFEVTRRATAGHAALATIASPDEPTNLDRNFVGDAAVGLEVIGIALGPLCGRGIDRDRLACGLLRRATAGVTAAGGDLVFGARVAFAE